MKIKVISLEECGSVAPTVALIIEVADRLGVTVRPEVVPVSTVEEARLHRHIGGPTVQINGEDIEPEARSVEQFGLC